MEETGEYDLEGLFVRLGAEIDAIGAKRVVLDTIEVLFSAFKDEVIIRAELKRLFQWLADRGVTAIVTGESGERRITRHGLEEYVADFVVVLNHLSTTRRPRGACASSSTAARRTAPTSSPSSSTSAASRCCRSARSGCGTRPRPSASPAGIAPLDEMLGGKGFYQGSSILVSGTAGTGKTSIAA